MDIKELYDDVKNLKTNLYNDNKEFMIKEVYSKFSTKDFLDIFDLIVGDVDKILDKVRFETKLELKKQDMKSKFIKEVFQ